MERYKDITYTLDHMGVIFFPLEGTVGNLKLIPPDTLMAELAMQDDARMRLALIAFLLQRPDIAVHADRALELLSATYRNTFMVYYTVAHLLQEIYADSWKELLGAHESIFDRYSNDLGIIKDNTPEERLKMLGDKQADYTGLNLNWFGTFNHTGQRIIKWLRKRHAWATA